MKLFAAHPQGASTVSPSGTADEVNTFNSGRRALLFGMVLAQAAVLVACSTTAGLAAPQKKALHDLGFVESEDGWALNLSGRLVFALNDATLSTEALNTVTRVARTLQSVGITHVTVDGHTDNLGTAALNQDLSERRAEAAAAAFMACGFQSNHIQRRGFGFTKPVADNATELGRQQNRRVAVIVLSL
jgi:outer membrane protein OmpA-like peptidoglycan-associated protein